MRSFETKMKQVTGRKDPSLDSRGGSSNGSLYRADFEAVLDFFRLLDEWEGKDERARAEN